MNGVWGFPAHGRPRSSCARLKPSMARLEAVEFAPGLVGVDHAPLHQLAILDQLVEEIEPGVERSLERCDIAKSHDGG